MLPVIISEYSLDTGIGKKKQNTPGEQTPK